MILKPVTDKEVAPFIHPHRVSSSHIVFADHFKQEGAKEVLQPFIDFIDGMTTGVWDLKYPNLKNCWDLQDIIAKLRKELGDATAEVPIGKGMKE